MKYYDTRYKGIYVGSDGEIYSDYKPGKMMVKKSRLKKGRKVVGVRSNGNKTYIDVCRQVALALIPNPEGKRYAIVVDKDPNNTHPTNIKWSNVGNMDYKAVAKSKVGMKYKKDYVGINKGCYSVISHDNFICKFVCDKCKDVKEVDIKNVHSYKGVCVDQTYPLNESLLTSSAFENWNVVETEESKKIKSKSKKTLKITCKNSGEQRIIKYLTYKNRKSILRSKKDRKLRKSIYIKYKNMKVRCYDINNKSYKSYGGRGIKICDEWLKNSSKFIDWSLANGYKLGLEIDRIDGKGNYEPSNCQYITKKENNSKKYTNILSKELVKKIKSTNWGDLNNRQIADKLGFKKERVRYGNAIALIRRGKTFKYV